MANNLERFDAWSSSFSFSPSSSTSIASMLPLLGLMLLPASLQLLPRFLPAPTAVDWPLAVIDVAHASPIIQSETATTIRLIKRCSSDTDQSCVYPDQSWEWFSVRTAKSSQELGLGLTIREL